MHHAALATHLSPPTFLHPSSHPNHYFLPHPISPHVVTPRSSQHPSHFHHPLGARLEKRLGNPEAYFTREGVAHVTTQWAADVARCVDGGIEVW